MRLVVVINTFRASLQRKGDWFVIRAGPNRIAVTAAKVQSIRVTTAVYFSSDVIALLIVHNFLN